jgi:hypothetical protein
VEGRLTGAFNLKSDRCNNIDEAEFRGKTSPAWKDANFKQVEARVKQVNMIKPKPEVKAKKVSLSPCSYENLDSYKKT